MKKILILIAFLYSINSFSQSTVLLRGDTIRVYKQGDSSYLKVDSFLFVGKNVVIGKTYLPLKTSVSLYLSDTTKAFRTNKMYSRFNIVTPENGMQIYEDSTDQFLCYQAGAWGGCGGSGGPSTGVDSAYVDSIFLRRSEFVADQKRGNVLGGLYEENGFANLDTFVTGGATISNSKILLEDAGADTVILNRYTALDRWTLKTGFIVGLKNGLSLGILLGIQSANSTFPLSFYGYFQHRSTVGFDGVLNLYEFNGVTPTLIATGTEDLTYVQGDSIELILDRNVNVFTFIARNVTTNIEEVSVSYTYTGYTSAVNTGRPAIIATGSSDSVYHFSFYSNESTNADLLTSGDSKFTWYSNSNNEYIPSILYSKYGNVINQGKSGDKTSELVLTTDEVIALNPRQVITNLGVSNDIRNSVSSGTWQANIDTIYNRFTRAGIEVYFALMYETDADQTAAITYLTATYPTRYISDGYTATQNCGSCLIVDNIHLTAYGNQKWVNAVAQSGMVDFFNPFRKMEFRAGDAGFIDVGDSLITNRYFRTTNKLNVFREGELQWEASSYEAGSITITHDSLFFHPPLSTGERIVIQSYSHVNWTTLVPDPPPFEFLLSDFPSAERAYSVRKVRSAYTGYCLKVRRSSDNTELDIGFVNNELDTASMKTFVGANNAFVTTWYNQANADASSDAIQATSGSQPRIMSSGVIDRVQNNDGDWMVSVFFDGTDDYMSFQNEPAGVGVDWSSFMVTKRTAAGEYGGMLSHSSNGPTTPYFKGLGGGDDIEIIRSGAAVHPFYRRVADVTATYCLLDGFVLSDVSTAYKNGSSLSLGTDTDYGFVVGSGFDQLGRLAGTVYSHAYISEAILYVADKSADRTAIETNINNFFHLY